MKPRISVWAGLAVGTVGLALAGAGAQAQNGPESLLPPGFDRPSTPRARTTPAARPGAAPAARPAAQATPARAPAPPTISAEALYGARPHPAAPGFSLTGTPAETPPAPVATLSHGPILLPAGISSFDQLIAMPPEKLDQLLGLTPKYDIPPSAQRSLSQVGLLDGGEGGLPPFSLAHQNPALVRAVLAGNGGQMVSRWGHILLRRALASRLDAPEGMAPTEFAALRAGLLLRLGEGDAARALVQDVDPGNYDAALVQSAMEAYIATEDFTGLCPVLQLQSASRADPQWQVMRAICATFGGASAQGLADIDRLSQSGALPRIDMLLAEKYAGAAGNGRRRAVKIAWDGVNEITPWRYALTLAVGLTPPAPLLQDAPALYDYRTALAPMAGLALRADASDRAGAAGVLSSAAMVDLYSQIYSNDDVQGEPAERALLLRDAYVGAAPADRVKAMQGLWDGARTPDRRYGRLVLTAYAAARLPAEPSFGPESGDLIAAMLAAGLDGNAARWRQAVEAGSDGWAQLMVGLPMPGEIDTGALTAFRNHDSSTKQHRSALLVAGLSGLGRISDSVRGSELDKISASIGGRTRWTDAIDSAAAAGNPTLVALLAGLGMQGDSWARMTPRYLYHIVAALNHVGLSAEARMIAAEAVARG